METITDRALTAARDASASLMTAYPNPLNLPPAGRWHYHQGVFLLSLQRLAELLGDEDLLHYTYRYVYHLISDNGAVPYAEGELDAMQAGNLLFPFVEGAEGLSAGAPGAGAAPGNPSVGEDTRGAASGHGGAGQQEAPPSGTGTAPSPKPAVRGVRESATAPQPASRGTGETAAAERVPLSPPHPKFRAALDNIVGILDDFPRTDQGGFWHKLKYPNQQWLDGLYMAGPVSVRYGVLVGDDRYASLFAEQAELIEAGARDNRTGLLRHGFDRSRQAHWAESGTGRAPEVWGRALGWFPAALLDMLDWLPPDSREANILASMFERLVPPILAVRDPRNHLWYQVLDRGDDPANWIESSCSSLFTYALAKGIRTGHLPKSMEGTVAQSFDALLKSCTGRGEDGRFEVRDICVGTGIGDYPFYLARPRSTNDLHGVGAFVLAAAEVARLFGGR